MNIELISMKLVNFKGIKEFEFHPDKKDVQVFGDNATGKTSLFDAFMWLFFSKDSLNRSTDSMGIKTVDEEGTEINNLNHEVEAVLSINGEVKTLKKVYKEKWTKQRSKPIAEFTGHTTEHFINDVPTKKKEFTELIESLVDEEAFKLVTNPMQFNENLHWKDRRKILFEVAGDVTDQEVLDSNKKFETLAKELNGNTVEEHKKIIASKKREINKRLDVIPELINENKQTMPDLEANEKATLESKIKEVDKKTKALNEQITSIINGSEINVIKADISKLNLKLNEVSNDYKKEVMEDVYKLEAKLQEEESNLSLLRSEVKTLIERKKTLKNKLDKNDTELALINEKGKSLKHKEYDGDCNCPVCEQELPESQIEQAKLNFNREKSKELEDLRSSGKALIESNNEIKEELATVESKIETLTEQGEKKAKAVSKLKEELDLKKETVDPVEKTDLYKDIVTDIENSEEKIRLIEQEQAESINKVKEEIKSHEENKSELQKELLQIEQYEKVKERIQELEKEQELLASEFEGLQEQEYLTDEFTVSKVEMIEGKINSKFKYARFKLFDKQINGGINETCETTFEGVSYSSGLNNAARINIGLDIINTLSEHYGIKAPIFVDNAESITQIIDVESQLISLIVEEGTNELTVEVKENKAKVA